MARLQRWQIGMLHTVPASLGIDETDRRTIQRNVGGSDSAATMGLGGFIQVMAYYEAFGWRDPLHVSGHWARQASDLAAPIRAKAIKLAALAGWTADGTPETRVDFARLDAFCDRQTSGRRTRLFDCDRDDLGLVVEGLKQIVARDPETAGGLRA